MKKILFLLCGLPGSGKTTWANSLVEHCDDGSIAHLSRDFIRFQVLQHDEKYFSHEDEVFTKFYNCINASLGVKDFIIVDATHLNEKSRNKILDKVKEEVKFYNVEIVPVNFMVDKETCLKRNAKRHGRARVPEDTIKSMNFVPATYNEKYKYYTIINVDENGHMKFLY